MLVMLERFDGKAVFVNPEQVVYVDTAERRLADQTEYSFVYLHDMNNAVQVVGSPQAINDKLYATKQATPDHPIIRAEGSTGGYDFAAEIARCRAKYGPVEDEYVDDDSYKEPCGDEDIETGEMPGQTSIDDAIDPDIPF